MFASSHSSLSNFSGNPHAMPACSTSSSPVATRSSSSWGPFVKPVRRAASCTDLIKSITPPSTSHQSCRAKQTSGPFHGSTSYTFTVSTFPVVSSSSVLPPFANPSISASLQCSTDLASAISRHSSCEPPHHAQSFLDLEDPSFMTTLRTLSPVSPFPLRFPRIRKDSHVAKSEAPSSPTLVNAQLPPRKSSLNPRSHCSNDEQIPEADAYSGFSDVISEPSPASPISQSDCRLARASDDTPFNSPTRPTFLSSDTDRDISETIKQLEELARDLKVMDVRVAAPRPPTRRLVRPPPRFSSLPRSRNAMHIHYDSSSSSSDSQTSLSGSLPESAPPSPPTRLAYLTEDTSPPAPQTIAPKIVLTIPSADELAEVPARSAQPSRAAVGGDGDEVQRVKNYEKWGHSPELDDDASASVTYSILSDYDDDDDDASSMFSSPPDSPALLTPNTSPIRHTFYPRSESASSECPSTPSTPTSPTQWLRRALSKPLLRIPKKADTPPPSPVSMPDGLALKASLTLSGKLSGDAFAPDLVTQDPFAKAPLDGGLHMMSAQCMESGEVLPLGERGGVSCWSASSESLVAHRRVGWSSLKQLFKRTR